MSNLPGVRTMPAVGIAHWRHWHLGWHHRGGAAQAQAALIKEFKQRGEFRPSFLGSLRMYSLCSLFTGLRLVPTSTVAVSRNSASSASRGDKWPLATMMTGPHTRNL
jgi:hypothetical protein